MTVIVAVAVVVTHCGSHGDMCCVASQYGDGVMSEVIHNRSGGRPSVPQLDFTPDLPAIAVCDCDDLGKIRAVRQAGDDCWQSVFVADCGHPTKLRDDGRNGCQWMQDEGVLFEAGAPLARQWGVPPGRSLRVEMAHWKARLWTPAMRGPQLVLEEKW